MVKCNKDQVERLKKALKRETDPVVRQRIQMVLLREDGKTQPPDWRIDGCIAEHGYTWWARPRPLATRLAAFLQAARRRA
jgi:hypothetical protein